MKGLRRCIEIATRPGEARAALEDDFHHFRVALRHAGGFVTAISADSPRHPFSACPMAAEPLQALVGMALDPAAAAVNQRTDPRHQCTHMLDLAGLAIAAAARGVSHRIYEAESPDRAENRTSPRLWRDGVLVLCWELHGALITGPARFAGLKIGQGFGAWVREHLTTDEAEAALVLRRAVAISTGRTRDLDALAAADAWGRCYTQQPERAASALRMKGSTLDFSRRAEALCRDDQAWLGFLD